MHKEKMIKDAIERLQSAIQVITETAQELIGSEGGQLPGFAISVRCALRTLPHDFYMILGLPEAIPKPKKKNLGKKKKNQKA